MKDRNLKLKAGRFVKNKRGQVAKILEVINSTTVSLSEWNNFKKFNKNYYPKNIRRAGWIVMKNNLDRERIKSLRNVSGNFSKKDLITEFLYDLMRDHLTPGKVEGIICNLHGGMCHYTNGWLAKYANNLSEKLKGNL